MFKIMIIVINGLWWLTFVILTMRRERQEACHKCEASITLIKELISPTW